MLEESTVPYSINQHSSTVTIVEFAENLTIDEIKELNFKVFELLEDRTDKQYIIYLIDKVEGFPKKVAEIQKASVPISTHELIDFQVIVGIENPIFKFLVNVIVSFFREDIKRAKTLDEALELIKQRQSSQV